MPHDPPACCPYLFYDDVPGAIAFLKAAVYVHFPGDFQKSRRMFCFRIGELNFVNAPGNSTDLSQIASVLECFRLK